MKISYLAVCVAVIGFWSGELTAAGSSAENGVNEMFSISYNNDDDGGSSFSQQQVLETIEENVEKVDEIVDEGEEIIDVVKSWIGPKPAPRRSIGFNNTQRFDMVVNRSLKKKYGAVRITNTDFQSNEIPRRLANWFDKIEEKDGTAAVCPVRSNSEFLGFIDDIKTLVGFVGGIVDGFNRWATYKPAKRYHAAVLVELEEGETAETFDANKARPVFGVTFYNKKKFGDLPKSCVPLADLEQEETGNGYELLGT